MSRTSTLRTRAGFDGKNGPGGSSSGSGDPGFDVIDDFELVIPSFQQQYGLRIRDELDRMTFTEFLLFLYALNEDTPLGKLVRVRTEKDKEQLKHFTPEMNRLRNEWQKKKAAKAIPKDRDAVDDMFKNFFLGVGKIKEPQKTQNGGEDHAG